MRSGSSAVVLTGRRRLGAGPWPNSTQADADAWWSKYGDAVAFHASQYDSNPGGQCGSGFRGKRGSDRDFPLWCEYWKTKGQADTSGFPDYELYDRYLKQLIAQIQSCQKSSDVTVPTSWTLSPPPGTAPQAVKNAYDSYALRMYTELPQARQTAQALCAATSAGTNSASSTGAPWLYAPQGTSQYPGSSIIPGSDVYGGSPTSADIYSSSGGDAYSPIPGGGATLSVNPFAPAPASTPSGGLSRKKMAVGGAGVALIVAGFIFWRHKKKRSR